MRENRLRAIWRAGGVAFNGWLQIPSAFSAEVMAHQGWDSLTVDLQHGIVDYQGAVAMLQAISTTQVVPLARVPWNEPGIIMKMLDAGCYGIICPMINTRAEAEAFAGACRYPPAGYRSFGPTRAALYGGADYAMHADRQILALAMIETGEGVRNVHDILAVPGIDGIYIGPADLSQSLGGPAQVAVAEPRVAAAIEAVMAAARSRGAVVGIHTGSVDDALTMVENGAGFVTLLSDWRLMAAAAGDAIAALHAGGAGRPPAQG